MTRPSHPPLAFPDEFHTTKWTRVCLAKTDSEEGRGALADLCEAYYEPVFTYLRRVLGDGDDARDATHAFFAELLAGSRIGGANRERGKFRAYLLGAVKHFLAHRREAERRQKRGGGLSPLSLDAGPGDRTALATDDDPHSPESAFDRQWAVTVLHRALASLEEECLRRERPDVVARLRPWLLGESVYGDQAAAAAEMGLSAPAMKALVHRMRARFRQHVKAEVAGTLNSAGDIEEEMRSLFAALGN